MIKKLFYSLISFIIVSNATSAQEFISKSTHQQHKEEFGLTTNLKSSFDPSGSDIIPLQTKKTSNVSKIVFGFLPYWEYASGAHDNLNYDLLTHIAAFDFAASSTGTLTPPSNWPWTDVINEAHSNGVKVVMTVTNFNSSQIHTLLTNSTSKNTLFTAIKNTITNYQLDGVNIDFEGLSVEDRGSLLNSFMADLTTYIHTNLPGKEVSFDAPAVNWGGWSLNNLAESVDHLIIMAYDYNGAWSSYTGAVSPLTHPSGGISVSKTLNNDYSEPIANYPEKLILAVPYYGKHWKTTTSYAGSLVKSYVGSTFYKNTVVQAPSNGGEIWDNNSQTPWYRYQLEDWHQVWADNAQSLSLKYDLAITKNLGGIGIWALNYDGDRPELWDLIDAKFKSTLAVEDSFLEQEIYIYPNPTKSFLNISTSNFIKVSDIEIYNLQGQKIKSYSSNENSIDISSLKSAVYILKIQDNKGHNATFKIIKT